MATKTNGAELKKFFDDAEYWNRGQGWYDESEFVINDSDEPDYDIDPSNLTSADTVRILAGIYYPGPDARSEDGISLETFFKRWRKKQSTTTLVVECSKDHEDAVKTAIKMAGGRVL